MKKYLFIAVISSVSFFSCAKVDTTPDGSNVNRITPPPPAPVNHCYILTNTEAVDGIVQYRYSFTDCNNNLVLNTPLEKGQSVQLCIADGMVTTNFAHKLVACP